MEVNVEGGKISTVDYTESGFFRFTSKNKEIEKGVNISINAYSLKYKGTNLIPLPITVVVQSGTYSIHITKNGYEDKSINPAYISAEEIKTISVDLTKETSNGSDAVPPQLQICSYNQILLTQTNASTPYSLSISIDIDYSKQVLYAARDKFYRRFAVPWISDIAKAFYQNKKKGILI